MIKLKEIIKSLLTAIHNIHFKKYVVKHKVNRINCFMLDRTRRAWIRDYIRELLFAKKTFSWIPFFYSKYVNFNNLLCIKFIFQCILFLKSNIALDVWENTFLK